MPHATCVKFKPQNVFIHDIASIQVRLLTVVVVVVMVVMTVVLLAVALVAVALAVR